MKLCLIVNPHAGKHAGHAVAAHLRRLLSEAGIEAVEIVSTEPGGTRRIAAGIDPASWDGVLAVGGDGSLFEVINGLLEHHEEIPIPIGQIPVGTGNSFIKDLGVNTVEEAVAPVLAGATRRVDLGHFTCDAGSFYFINLLGAGFVSNVAHRARKYKLLGSFAYIAGVLEEVVALRSTPVTLEVDGTVIERDAIFVEICNSRYTGGNMMMAPGALIDDGLLDVVLVNRISRRTVLKLLPTIFEGRHVESPAVEVFRGARIRFASERPLLLTPDGETFGTTPIDVTMHPAKLEVFGA